MSVCQGKTQTSHMLEGHLLPSEAQELGRRWSRGVSSALGPLAALPGLCSMRPHLGPARVHQALLCPDPCHSLPAQVATQNLPLEAANRARPPGLELSLQRGQEVCKAEV